MAVKEPGLSTHGTHTMRRSRIWVQYGFAAICLAVSVSVLGASIPDAPGKREEHSGKGRWVFDRIVLHLRWGDQPGQIGRSLFDADASPKRTYRVTRGPRITVNPDQSLCIADAANSRVQHFDRDGKLRWHVGGKGLARGQVSGWIRRALVGPSGDVYFTQTQPILFREEDGKVLKEHEADSAAWQHAGEEAWRLGVIRLTPAGRFVFSTHAAELPADSESRRIPYATDFWVDDNSCIYEVWAPRGEMARFTPSGAFERSWSIPAIATGAVCLGRNGRFYWVREGKARPLPDGTWEHRMEIRGWDTDGRELRATEARTTGSSQEWGAVVKGVDTRQRLVIWHSDDQPLPDGTVIAEKMVFSLLLVDGDGRVIAKQNWRDLLASVPRPQPEVPGTHQGLVVGSSLDLYWSLFFENEFQLARFRWEEQE